MFNFTEILSVTLVIFSAIDILGSIPIILSLRARVGKIESEKATLMAAVFMYLFLFLGEHILGLFGLDPQSFAIAGALVILLLGLEMTLGLSLFRYTHSGAKTSIVPLAFPVIAGPGTLTTILTLRAEFSMLNIAIGAFLNLIPIYFVLKNTDRLERWLGPSGINVIRTIFGIILLALAVKILRGAFST